MQTPVNGAPVLAGTDPTDPLEQLRARLVLSIGACTERIKVVRINLAGFLEGERTDDGIVSDVRVLSSRLDVDVAVRRAYRELLADVDELSGRERGSL